MLDVEVEEVLRMVERLYERERMVTDFDVRLEAGSRRLGRDGDAAVRSLPPGRYTREELIEALTDVLFARMEFCVEPQPVLPRSA